jgi:hypothetical protein
MRPRQLGQCPGQVDGDFPPTSWCTAVCAWVIRGWCGRRRQYNNLFFGGNNKLQQTNNNKLTLVYIRGPYRFTQVLLMFESTSHAVGDAHNSPSRASCF